MITLCDRCMDKPLSEYPTNVVWWALLIGAGTLVFFVLLQVWD